MNRTSRYIKAGAAALAVQVFFTNCLFASAAETSFYADRAKRLARPSLLASLPAAMPMMSPSAAPAAVRLPAAASDAVASLDASLGNVRSVTLSPAANRSIVYIQDVHGNDEAQRHIAGAVTALVDQNKADVLVLEGAAGPVDIRVFRSGPWRDSARRVADGLLADHRISGAVLGAVNARRSVPIVGAEQGALYDWNVDAARRAKAQTTVARRAIAERAADIAARKERTYSPALLAFDRLVSGHREGTVPLGRYAEAVVGEQAERGSDVAVFLQAVHMEESLDTRAAERERTAMLVRLAPKLSEDDTRGLIEAGMDYRTARISASEFYRRLSAACRRSGVALSDYPALNHFVQYVLLADTINMERVSAELDRMELARFEKLAATGAERALVARSALLELQRGLVEFSLNAEEWRRYRASAGKDPLLEPFETFYRSAELRNAAIARNVLAAMAAHGPRAVLVTGGFHSSEVSRAIGDRASISTFVPRLTSVGDETPSEALSVFTRERTPLDRLLEGERLFLAPAPAPRAALAAAIPMTAADAVRAKRATAAQAIDFASTRSGWTVTDLENGDSSVALDMTRGGMAVEMKVPFDDVGRPRYPVLQRLTNRFQSLALNSTWSLAPTVAFLTVAAFSLAGVHFSLYDGIGLYALTKVLLTWAVLWHERAHLAADGQLDGLPGVARATLILNSIAHRDDLQRMSFFAALNGAAGRFVAGTDMTGAWVRLNARQMQAVRAAADAGRQANVRQTLYGAGILLLGATAMAASVPFFAVPLALAGFLWMTVNAVVLLLGRGSEDHKAAATGVPALQYGATAGERPSVQVLNDDVIDLQPTPKSRLNPKLVQPFLDLVLRELGDRRTEEFVGIMYPALLAIVSAALEKNPAKFEMHATLDGSDFRLSIRFEKGSVPGEALAAVEREWMSDVWTMGVATNQGTGLQTITISGRIPPTLTADTIPTSPEEMTALLTGLTDSGRATAISVLRSALEPSPKAPYIGTDRLAAALWSNDLEVFGFAVKRLLASSEPAARPRLAAELDKLSSASPNNAIRRQAAWMLATVPGFAADAAPGQGWRYQDFAGLRLPNLRTVRVDLTTPGVADLIVEEPAGFLSMILLAFRIRLKRTVAVIRLTYPGAGGVLDESVEGDWLRFAKLSFPTDKRPSLELFDAVMRFWATRVAPMNTMLEMPVDSRRDQPIRESGFRRSVHRDLDNGTVTLQKIAEARGPAEKREPYDAQVKYLGMVLRAVFLLPINFFAFLDEMFHYFGSRVEGNIDATEWISRVGVLFGLGLDSATSDFIPHSEDFYRQHPKLREFRGVAAPLGFLIMTLVFGALAGLYMGGIIHLPSWGVWATYYLAVGSALQVVMNLVITDRIGKWLIGPDFKGTDFWRWWNAVTAKRTPPAELKPKDGRAPSLEELLEREKGRSKYHSVTRDMAAAIRGAVRRTIEAVRERMLALNGLVDLRDAILRGMSANGRLSPTTVAAVQARAAHLMRRSLNAPSLAEVQEFHETTFAVLLKPMTDGDNPLIGSLPRNADGTPMSADDLQSFFTEPGWNAFKAYRDGNAAEDFGGVLRRPRLGRLQLSLAALDPNADLEKFFQLVGKPDAAAAARRQIAEGRAADVVILDSAAIPWTPIEGGERLGSVSADLSRLGKSERRAALRRLFAADAALLTAAILIQRTRGMSDPERASLLNIVRAAIDGSAPLAMPLNYSAEREEMGRTVRELTALRKTVQEQRHTVESDFAHALGGFFRGGAGATATADLSASEQESPFRGRLVPAGGKGGGTNGGGARGSLFIPANAANPANSANAAVPATAVDPLETLLTRALRRSALTTGEDRVAATVPNESGTTGDLRDNPSSLSGRDLTPAIPSVGANVKMAAHIAAGTDRTGAATSGNVAGQTQRDAAATAANAARATSTANRTGVRVQPAAAVANEAERAVSRDAASDNSSNAVDGSRTGEATPGASRQTGGASAVVTDQNVSGRSGEVFQQSDRADRAEQSATDRTNALDRAAAEAARTGARVAAGADAGRTDANGTPIRAGNETRDRNSADVFQKGSPLAAFLATLSSRGMRIGAAVSAVALGVAGVAVAVQSLAIPQLWLPATLSAVLATTLTAILLTVRSNTDGAVAFAFPFGLSATDEEAASASAAAPTVRDGAEAASQPAGGLSVSVIAFSNRVIDLLTSATARPFLFQPAGRVSAVETRILRAAAVSTLDAAAALLSDRRNISVLDAVALIADDRLTGDERAVVTDLARATQAAARSAIARTLGARSKEDRAALAARDIARPAVSVRPTLTELRRVALLYRERVGTAASMNAARDAQLARSIARGRALLVLERAWAEEIVNAPVSRSRPVRVFRLGAARPSSPRRTTPETLERPRIGADGVLENTDLLNARSAGARVRGETLGERLGFGADPLLARASEASLGSASNRQLVAALGIAAANTGSSLAVGESAEDAGRKSAESAVGSDLMESTAKASSRTPALDAALAQDGLTGREPGSVLVEKILSGLKKPASIAATVTVVALAGAAVAFGIVEAVVAVLTVTVMLLIAIGSQIARMQRDVRAAAESSPSGGERATAAQGSMEGPRYDASDLERLADLITSFISGRAKLGSTAGAADFAKLLPTIGTLGVANRRIASQVAGLSESDAQRLRTLVSERVAALGIDRRPSEAEALAWLKALMAASGQEPAFEAIASDKDLFYPVRTQEDMQRELAGIAGIRARMTENRFLYLSYENEEVRKQLFEAFGKDSHIKLLDRSSRLYKPGRNGHEAMIDLDALAAEFEGQLKNADAKNLLVVIPEHVGWEESSASGPSVLDNIRFVILREFVAGVQVDRAALRNLGHLAEMIATQA